MRSIIALLSLLSVFPAFAYSQASASDLFPDGSKIPDWFFDAEKASLDSLGKQFVITDYGAVSNSSKIQTKAIQDAIDAAANEGGGVVVIPKGEFISGAIFFKPGTKLHVSEEGILKGSDSIVDYPKMSSRMEGQRLSYYSALVNAYGVDGFSITGTGKIDGNGLKFWKAFWKRREENPQCTNLEVSRPRLVFVWNCKDVQLQDVKLHNAGFWSSHFYQCERVKILDVHYYSPHAPVKAPSTDAIDLDVCSNVLIKGCYMSVNDDAIALKGGKGPWADEDPDNGENTNILIEDCEFGFCHSTLTCGSESIHNRNVLMRNCKVSEATRVLWLKMRPDTPQHYEYITLENIEGQATNLVFVKPWRQFFDLKGRKEVPISRSNNITLRNIKLNCDVFFNVAITEYDHLSDFTFENLSIEAEDSRFDKSMIDGVVLKNVVVNNAAIE